MLRLFLSLIASLAVVGCVGQARSGNADLPIPLTARDAPAPVPVAESLTQTGEIPLVPVPPPPLYKNEKDKLAKDIVGKERTDKAVQPVVGVIGEKAAPLPAEPLATAPRPAPGFNPGPLLPPETPPPGPATSPTGPLPGIPLPAQPAPAIAPAPAPVAVAAPADVPLERILQQASDRHAAIDSYIARLTRRESVGGKRENEELMLFKFRKQPFSVYFKWLGETSQGREVIYVQGKHENKIHTLLAAGDVPFMPAGKRMALSPDNILVQSATRHPITSAGMGSVLDRLLSARASLQQGDTSRGRLNDLGNQRRPDYPACELRVLEHILPPGMEKLLPQGGKRVVCFCPQTQLPVLIQTYDERGQEVEYYRYDRLQPSVALDDLDFNPEVLWKKPDAKPAQP